ncbi:ADP-forming succinate--CoA ligase subunit beta [Sedimenticola selenatireducens]|uniref:Succinate--CoA ligase [ADP-forming] subunit beta n=1 Tax=Sedimenticola selenatireducens TaxID=191960 RepID=A0A2N6CXM1_9GAMM|nr:ADP-forming succinate--CoA ligase subunit beta [Sedimenticola selenatireducens]PLX62052.1 MAG: ADP-forming succinate--CoA ligase subunit beta [Sedimenticola selenatireducens]
MNLHEYQSKQLFAKQGIPVPEGSPVTSVKEARRAAEALGGDRWVVKAQVHAGGRGKVGGVVLVDSLDQVEAEAQRLLGSMLVTKQTGEPGLPINTLLVETITDIERELYLSVLVDRESKKILFMASQAVGMNIEEVAEETPEQIHIIRIDPAAGLQGYQCRRLAFALALEGTQIREFQKFMFALYNLFIESDASLVEINPLVVTKAGNLIALDAKINLDSNALYRQPNLLAMRDISQEDEREAKAAEHDLNYITLDGNIGCMVNGAGLAMATMDLVQLKGGSPANFLDVGGGTTAERVAEAFKLILSDDKVQAVLVNIFGGIVRCDLIAEGIIEAVKEVDVKVPVVVRLEGTKAPEGLELLANSGLAITTAADLSEGAEKVVAAAKG